MPESDSLNDFAPASWLDRGILFIQASIPKRRIASAVLTAAQRAALSAALVTAPSLVLMRDASAAWPPTPVERAASSVADTVASIFDRIDRKLANFSNVTFEADPDLLREARLTLASIDAQTK